MAETLQVVDGGGSRLPARDSPTWVLLALLAGGGGMAAGGGVLKPAPPVSAVPAPVPTPAPVMAPASDPVLVARLDDLDEEVEQLAKAQAQDHMTIRGMNRSLGWVVLATQKTMVAIGALAAAQNVVVDLVVTPMPQVELE